MKLKYLEVVLMDNGELICKGKTVGWENEIGEFLKDSPAPVKKIVVPVSEAEAHELMNGGEFCWKFDNIEVNLRAETEEDVG